MRYRRFGVLDWEVSALGFGVMRLPSANNPADIDDAESISMIRYAIDRGVKITGCTVHFVDNHYDNGPIILQRSCEVKDDDTKETLASRVFEQECEAYPEAIQLFAEGRLKIEGRLVRVLPRR